MSRFPVRLSQTALLALVALSAALPARGLAQPSSRFTVGGREIVKMDFASTPLGDFPSALEMVERPLSGNSFFELSPYLQAFGALPAEGAVAAPTPNWGTPFAGRARLRGTERVTVPAGSFEAVRLDIEISRTPYGKLQPRIDPAFTLATVWYAPGPKRAVQWKLVTRASALNVLVDDTYQLASYRPA